MMREYDFRVAGFLFKLHLPEEQDIDRLLPSFRPFRCVTDIQGRAIFNFVAVSSSLSEKGIIRVLEETESDLGHIRLLEMAEGYRVELRYTAGSPVHVLHAEPFFTLAMFFYLPDYFANDLSIRFVSALVRMEDFLSPLFLLAVLFVRMWLLYALFLLSFPDPVSFILLLAPL